MPFVRVTLRPRGAASDVQVRRNMSNPRLRVVQIKPLHLDDEFASETLDRR